MKVVFKLFIPCFYVMLLSASSCEDQVKTEEAKEEISDAENVTRAVVTRKFIDDGCEVLLEIQENGEEVLLLPIELDDQFKVDGVELLITFHSSRMMQSTCQIGRPIVIDSAKLVD